MAKNPNLKRAHATSEFNSSNIQELIQCKKDPIYFMEKYVKVQHPTKGMVPFVLYPYQKEMVLAIHENKDTILLCSRQMGKCFFGMTKLLNTAVKPTGFRKHLLKFVDLATYDSIFSPGN